MNFMVDTLALEIIRRRYTDDPAYESVMKYFMAPVQIEHSLEIAGILGLTSGDSLDILDFATGPGWFPLVCRWMDHRVDLADIDSSSHRFGPVYDAILKVLELRKSYTIEIKPFIPIPELGKRYDLITGLHLFCFEDWTPEPWDFFLADLRKHLKPGGQIGLLVNDTEGRTSLSMMKENAARLGFIPCGSPRFPTLYVWRAA